MSSNIEKAEAGGLAGVYRASRADYSAAGVGDRIVLAGALTGVALEWGTGNEALIGMVGGNLHEATDNPVITSLGTGGVSFVEQLALGSMMASAIGRFPLVASSLRNLTEAGRAASESNSGDKRSRVSRFLSAFVLGAAVDVAIANSKREHTRAESQKRVLSSAVMVGGSVALIGGAASAGLKAGAEHGFETQAHMAVNVISSPWTYVSLFATKIGYDKIKSWAGGRREKRALSRQTEGPGGTIQLELESASAHNPNALQIADFNSYRSLCDSDSGLMRVGLTVPELYDSVVSDSTTQFGLIDGVALPIVASVDPFHIPEEGEAPKLSSDRSALVPLSLIPAEERHDLVATRQFLLDSDATSQIIKPATDAKLRLRDVPSFLVDKVEGELVQGHGEPQFTVFSRYDVSECDAFRANPPAEVTTRDGHTITTNKEKILQYLPELVELHEAVFKQQAMRIGYYDGLVGDLAERFLKDDAFIGVAAFDKDTGKPFMFAIFASGLDGLDQIPWLNKGVAESLIDDDGVYEDPTLALPIVITAKFNGLGVFSETVSLAMHEILYRTQEKQTLHALYNANLQSVLYTPRIINASAEQNGARLRDSLIEASVTTKIS